MPSVLECARAAREQGLSVIPVGSDKRPLGRWAQYQTRIPTLQEVDTSFNGNVRMAILGGPVSGGFEAIDFDVAGYYEDWRELLSGNGHDDLLDRLVVVRTPSGGYHVYFQSEHCETNQKLAYAYDADGKPKIAIETRAKGGYVVTFPSQGYTMVQGRISVLPALAEDDRFALLHAARLLNVVVEETAPPTQARTVDGTTGKRPGDDYNARAEWSDLLGPDGRYWRNFGPVAHWTRNGKKSGTSFTTGLGTSDLGYCWSSNWNPRIPSDWSGSKFALYTLLNHGGDYAAAASALRKQGYGDPLPKIPEAEHGEAVTLRPDAGNGETGPVGGFLAHRILWSEMKAMPAKEMLVERLLGRGDSAMMVGLRKGGKTAVVFDLILSMIAGTRFAGRFNVVRPMTVLYCTTEGTGAIHTRFDAANVGHGIPDEILEKRLIYVPKLPQVFDPEHDHAVLKVAGEFAAAGIFPDLMVLDTFAKSTLGAEENSNSDISRALATLQRAREIMGAASLPLHHVGKNGAIRGASAIDGDLDILTEVEWDEEGGARKFNFLFAKDLGPFDSIPFGLDVVDADLPGAIRVNWTPGKLQPTQPAIERALVAMKRDPEGLWSLSQIHSLLPDLKSNVIQTALNREAAKTNSPRVVELKVENAPIKYRLTAKGLWL